MKLEKNILLADNQALIRSGLRHWLEEGRDFLIHEVETLQELKIFLDKHFVDIVMLDHLTLANFEITDLVSLQSQFQKTSFIIISGDQDESSILKILSTGISGYLTKVCSKEEILQAVLTVNSGEKFFCNKVINLLINLKTKKDDEYDLTDRETEIVKLIAEGNSTMQIASLLNLSHHTINSHRKNILRKLKIKSPVELVVYAINTGIIQPK